MFQRTQLPRKAIMRIGIQPRQYWVLALSKGNTRLLKLEGNALTEINDEHFPVRYEEQFQYERKTGQIVQYYDDESRVQETRMHGYFRHVKHLLGPYLKAEDLPIVLMTANSNAADFKRVTHLGHKMARCIHGNFDHHRVSQLKTLLKEKLKFEKG